MSNSSMRAMMYLGPEHIELQQTPRPEPGDDDILVKIRAATTCGTDAKTYRRGHHLCPPPSLFGHEFAGDIEATGANVKNFKTGMRVVAHNSAPCQTCYYCKHGQHNLCSDLLFNFGAFADYALIPGPIAQLNTFEIPDHLSYAQASILEPFTTVVHGQRVIQIQPGEIVAIIGAGGPIGLMHLQMALHSGAAYAIAVDLSDTRLKVAEEMGATTTINPQVEDPVEVIFSLTGGRGVDVAIESAGSKEAWLTAVNVVRKGGRVLWFGGLKGGTPIELDTHKVHYGELTLYGTFHGTPLDVLRAFELISSGVIDTQALISGELPLEQVEDALKMMMRGEVVKMVINPELDS
ncbi:MAG: zinc-binding dehydrogenase [Anaerolineales bacterium]|nr:zinc-binding dehydrogenase [Anaerolineales bacterium]